MDKQLKSNRFKNKSLLWMAGALIILVLVNMMFSRIFWRFDLTSEKRYSISAPTKNLLGALENELKIEVYLAGELPAAYKRLQISVEEMLDEYNAYASKQIRYEIIDPFDQASPEAAKKLAASLEEKGLESRLLSGESIDEISKRIIFPGAIIIYGDKEVAVNFLSEQRSDNEPTEGIINSGISMLEYKLSSAIRKLLQNVPRRIVFVQGHGELPPPNVADVVLSLQNQNFEVQFIDLQQEVALPKFTDLAIIAKPTQSFNEQDKFKIDQYLMSGGSLLWFVDPLQANIDSLFGAGAPEATVTEQLPLNLDNLLFEYGARINLDLIQDEECARLMRGPTTVPWYFFPVLLSPNDHPVNKHLGPVISQFASSVDTIKVPNVKKTIIMTSSPVSRLLFHPVRLRLEMSMEPATPALFNKKNIPLGILLEGQFRSAFRNRPLAKEFLKIYRDSLGLEYREVSEPAKMIVVGDGDIIKNEIAPNGMRFPLGYYKYVPKSNYLFANKDFVLNCVDYLTDNYGLIVTRNKQFKIRPFDKGRLANNRGKWQLINLAVPIMLLLIFGAVYNFIRKRKYSGKK